jgi:putative FmdB family regulatory protein
MPIYEFRCEHCGAELKELVTAGTTAATCPSCGPDGAKRTFSAQAAPLSLVKTRGEARRQERRKAKLRETTKASFKSARRRAREGRSSGPGGGS